MHLLRFEFARMRTKSTMHALDIKILWWRLASLGDWHRYQFKEKVHTRHMHGFSTTNVRLERYIMFVSHVIFIYNYIYIASIHIVYQFDICIRPRSDWKKRKRVIIVQLAKIWRAPVEVGSLSPPNTGFVSFNESASKSFDAGKMAEIPLVSIR